MAAALAADEPIWRIAAEKINATVGAVLCVFVFLYYVDVACVILPWLSYSVPGTLHLMLLTATTGLALFCYFKCMVVNPGRVPPGWQPDTEPQAAPVQEVKKKDGAPRYCKKCNHYKPPRSHHCRVCNRCVLRMDHHCPWVNNCIGHANYRSFFLLLVYCSMALLHTSWLLISHVVHIVRSARMASVVRVGPKATPVALEAGTSQHLLLHIGLQALAIAVALPTSIAVVSLLTWHVRMVATNKTTIEHAEGVTAQIKAVIYGQEPLLNPYDLGCWGNFYDVFGHYPNMWCIPTCDSKGTPGGLSYTTVFDSRALGF